MSININFLPYGKLSRKFSIIKINNKLIPIKQAPMTIAATGHRPNKLGNDYTLSNVLCKLIQQEMYLACKSHNVTEAITGMALGADTLWALAALQQGIPLTAAIPFRGQELRWPTRSQNIYNQILKAATKIVYVHDEPAPTEHYKVAKYMQDRNVWMVDHADKLLAVWDGSSGGTKNCIVYAGNVKPRMEIIRIDPRKL